MARPSLRLALLPLALLGLAPAGCHPRVTNPQDPKFIVAEGGHWTLTRAELNDQTADYLRQQQMTPEQIGPDKKPLLETYMLKSLVLKKILLERAAALPAKDIDQQTDEYFQQLKSRFPSEKEFDDQLKGAGLTADAVKKQLRERVLIQKLLETEAFHDTEPTAPEIDAFYAQNKDRFHVPTRVDASRILVAVDEKATPADRAKRKAVIDAAHTRVVKGEDFAKVAGEVSEDRNTSGKGGEMGYFQRGENEAPFDDVAFSLKAGAVSPVFLTLAGYQFLKVNDLQPEHDMAADDARKIVANYLRKSKRQDQQEAYAAKALEAGKVAYHVTLTEPPASAAGATTPAPADATDASAPAVPAPASNAAPAH